MHYFLFFIFWKYAETFFNIDSPTSNIQHKAGLVKNMDLNLFAIYEISTIDENKKVFIFILWRQIKIRRSPDEQPFKRVWELVHLNIVITKRGV